MRSFLRVLVIGLARSWSPNPRRSRARARCLPLLAALASLLLVAGCGSWDPYAGVGAIEETITIPQLSAELTIRYPKVVVRESDTGKFYEVVDIELSESDGPVTVSYDVGDVCCGGNRYLNGNVLAGYLTLKPGEKARRYNWFIWDELDSGSASFTVQLWDASDPNVPIGMFYKAHALEVIWKGEAKTEVAMTMDFSSTAPAP
jgi:hypothetical protein